MIASYPDTVYLTANPNLKPEYEPCFYQVFRLWESEWDEELNTATPDRVTERALDVASELPHKRLVVHFIQPHRPFIGEIGRKLSQYYDHQKLWQELNDGSIEIENKILWKAYRETCASHYPISSAALMSSPAKLLLLPIMETHLTSTVCMATLLGGISRL
jgi:hypothetical protein